MHVARRPVRVPAAEQLILAAEQLGGGAERAIRQVWLASDPRVWVGGLGAAGW